MKVKLHLLLTKILKSQRFVLIIFSLCFLLLCSCIRERENKTLTEPDFLMPEDAELFFKNTRQLFYDKETPKNTVWSVYRFKKRSLDKSEPILNLAIVVNPSQDKAFLRVEPNKFLANRDSIEVVWEHGKHTGKHIFKQGNVLEEYHFARSIYSCIKTQDKLFILENGKKTPFLTKDKDRNTFRITVEDFYRLLGE